VYAPLVTWRFLINFPFFQLLFAGRQVFNKKQKKYIYIHIFFIKTSGTPYLSAHIYFNFNKIKCNFDFIKLNIFKSEREGAYI